MTKKPTPYMLAIIAIIAIVGIALFQNNGFSSDQNFVGQVYTIGGSVSTCSEETEAEDCDGYACISNRISNRCRTTCRTDPDCAEGYFCIVKPSRGECYEESPEGYTAGGTVYGVSQFDIFEHTIDQYLLFKLHIFEFANCDGTCDESGIGFLTALSDESLHHHEASSIKTVLMLNNINMRFHGVESDGPYKSYVLFPDAAFLRPSKWVIVSATLEVLQGNAKDHSVILTKQTKDCNSPLYALTIQNRKYHFIISIDGTTYKLSSDTAVASGIERRLLGVYDGTQIKFFVDDILEDAAQVEGRISASSDSSHLVFGRSTACDAYQFYGLMEDIYIWGE